jgi:hypothetical protein
MTNSKELATTTFARGVCKDINLIGHFPVNPLGHGYLAPQPFQVRIWQQK